MPKVKTRLTYSVEVECDEEDARHYMNPWNIDKNKGELAQTPSIVSTTGKPATIAGAFEAFTEKFSSSPAVGTRAVEEEMWDGSKKYWKKSPYTWQSYSQLRKAVDDGASGLLTLPGVQEQRKTNKCVAALLADTSAEWQVASHIAFKCGIAITTIYTTLGPEAMLHGLKQTEAIILFVDWEVYDKLKEPVFSQCEALRHIVLIGECFVPKTVVGATPRPFPSPAEADALPMIKNAKTTTLKALSGKGNLSDVMAVSPKTEDLAFIMYTSGSTGLPKGVTLTHSNFMGVVAGIENGNAIKLRSNDVYIAYLPLAHILELMVEMYMLTGGCQIGYGHPRTLTGTSPWIHPDHAQSSDLLMLTPTIMMAVPAILDLIKSGVVAKTKTMPGLGGKLIRGAIANRLGESHNEGCVASCLLSCLTDTMIKKLKEGLGVQNVRVFGSGGAPLAADTQTWVTKIIAPVAQGYGSTECLGGVSMQEVEAGDGREADLSTGAVGSLVPCVELKLKSVPEMGYLVTDVPPRGEILISGTTVSQGGYFGLPDKTEEDFPVHADGKKWFHTGDVGLMTPQGTLKIIDRKKDLVKLAGGEYVSLGKVEAALKAVSGIGACIVFVRPDKDHCVVIVSQPERGWNSVGGKPVEANLVSAIQKELKSQGLAKFEIPTKACVDELIWTPENGLVTASLKVQRNPLRAHYNKPGGFLEKMDYQFPES